MSDSEGQEKNSTSKPKEIRTILAIGIIAAAFVTSIILGGLITDQPYDVTAIGGPPHIESLQISFRNPSIFALGCELDRDEFTVIADFYLVNEENFDQTVFIQLKIRGELVATGGYVAPADTSVPREIRAEHVNCTVVPQEIEVVVEPAGV